MLDEILNFALQKEASDIHIVSNEAPIIRVNGEIVRISKNILSQQNVDEIVARLLNDKQKENFAHNKEIDFAFHDQNKNRFRANIFKTIKGSAIAIRPIKSKALTLEQINAPEIIKELLKKRRGLIIVSGPTGCGKSTSLAAMIDYINQNYACNIITIEDPIEFIHHSKKSLISQREIESHSQSFAKALKASLREDPDIILIGELRDLESFSLALTAAETGHLVLATLHTSSAANAINRIVDVFPEGEQKIVRSMLANSLNGIILQRLLTTTEKKRRVAFEIMVSNSSVKNLIREGKIAQINSMMEIGSKYGMVTMKDSIENLFKNAIISEEEKNKAIESFVS